MTSDFAFQEKIVALREMLWREGKALAKQGLGWEDVWAKLRKDGMTKDLAREIVLGNRK